MRTKSVLNTISRRGDVFAHRTSLKPQLFIIHIFLCQARKVITLHLGTVLIVWYFYWLCLLLEDAHNQALIFLY